MANPKFTDSNGNFGYTWEELPVIPSDRADVATPMNTQIGMREYFHAGLIVGRKYITKRGEWQFRWKSITQGMVISIQDFLERSSFRFYPDANVGTYKEVYISNAYRPKWQPGGRYDLTLDLKQYAP